MKLVSMKIKPEKKDKKGSSCCDCCSPDCSCEEKDRYPWGLRVRLESEQLDALGIKDLPKVKTSLTMQAKVTVISVSSTESQDGGEYRCVELQITECGFEGMAEQKKGMDMGKMADTMYGGEKGA
jgi:hypothetical protein